MTTIYLLCEWDDSLYGRYDPIAWYESEGDANAEAERLEWDRYTREMARTDRTRYEPVRPDKREHRDFFVKAVDKAQTP